LSENLEVVRRQFESFDAGGLDAMVEFWHPEIDWRAVEGAADDAGVLRGRDAMRRYYEDWIDAFEMITTTVEEVLLDEGECLVVKLRVAGRGRASGAPADSHYFVAYTIRDGLILRGREYATGEEAVAGAIQSRR
jgi:ketosteroid isomerase-like protein